MLPVVSPSDAHFGFVCLLFTCPIGHACEIMRRKIGHDELNLPRPASESFQNAQNVQKC